MTQASYLHKCIKLSLDLTPKNSFFLPYQTPKVPCGHACRYKVYKIINSSDRNSSKSLYLTSYACI